MVALIDAVKATGKTVCNTPIAHVPGADRLLLANHARRDFGSVFADETASTRAWSSTEDHDAPGSIGS